MKRIIATFGFVFLVSLLGIQQDIYAQNSLNQEVKYCIVSDASGADVNFKTQEVYITDGCCEVRVNFYNNGDKAAEIIKVQFSVTIKYGDRPLFKIYKEYDLDRFYVWNGYPQKTFVIWDSRFKKEQNGDDYGWTIDDKWFQWYNRDPIGM